MRWRTAWDASLQPQCLEIAFVDSAISELYLLQVLGERFLNFLLRGTIGSHFLKGRPWVIGKRNDPVPLRRLLYRCDAGGGVHLLVRPEAPTYPVLFEQRPERRDPFILIFAGLAHPDGHVV